MSTSKWPPKPQFCERWRYIWQKNGQKLSYNSYKRVTFISEHSLLLLSISALAWKQETGRAIIFVGMMFLGGFNLYIDSWMFVWKLRKPLLLPNIYKTMHQPRKNFRKRASKYFFIFSLALYLFLKSALKMLKPMK